MALLQRISHRGAAVPAALVGTITPSTMSFVISQTAGWPTGAGAQPFGIVIDPDTPIEEKILCATQASGTITVVSGGRGADNTVPTGHQAGAIVEHCAFALELDDDNDHIYNTTRFDHDAQYARLDGTNPFTGPLTLQSGLTVTGPTSLTGPLTENGNATISGTLGVSGATTLASTTISGTLGVSGATSLAAATVTTLTASGEVKGTDMTATGLPGATSGGRYVGGTASGAPTSGTFAAGDFIVDRTGQIWICVTAGTPGTWVPQIGSMVGHGTGPSSTTNFTGHAPAFAISVAVVAGCTYKIDGRILGTQVTANGGIVLADMVTADGLVAARFLSTYIPVGTEEVGGGATIWQPTATASRQVTLNVQASSGAFQVGANQAELIVTRID